ncbi:Peptidase inhibitor 15-A [Bagarius yarrelli]|uniref:Peptidase inhibitor 15-A n=1 Tax=Bagarius yarrelli TaxID=175774 RepID=A0A556TWB2_BAGYA|nr:Peptidase inhibitor 15-A [Bagarius yarrelli]
MNEHGLAIDLLLICMSCGAASVLAAFNSTVSAPPSTAFSDNSSKYHMDIGNVPKTRRKRYISQDDRQAILDYHNKVRGNVFPPASNMEYMVWDETLAQRAEEWATMCLWEHGPRSLLRFLGQNLSVRTGRYRSILQLVKPWHDEVKDYSFPGNWIGEAPYKVGVPCSMCPPSYGGSCSNNMCVPAVNSNYLHWFK